MPLVLNDNLTPVMIETFCGKVIDVPNPRVADQTPLQQWAKNGGDNQRWIRDACGAECTRLVSRSAGRVIDMTGGEQGVQVQLFAWAANDNQRWVIEETKGGVIIALAKNRNIVLDVAYASEEDGAPIITWTRNGGANQRFRLVE